MPREIEYHDSQHPVHDRADIRTIIELKRKQSQARQVESSGRYFRCIVDIHYYEHTVY